MKHLLRVFLFHVFSLWLVAELFPALKISGGVFMMVTAAFILSLLMIIVKPMLKILFIPINFLTFGLAGLFINVVLFYLLTLILPEVTIREYTMPGFTWQGFMVPSIPFTQLSSLICVSLGVTCISHILHGISEG